MRVALGWFKFSNLVLALGVAKGLKLKVIKFWGLLPTFVAVKLVGGGGGGGVFKTQKEKG